MSNDDSIEARDVYFEIKDRKTGNAFVDAARTWRGSGFENNLARRYADEKEPKDVKLITRQEYLIAKHGKEKAMTGFPGAFA